MSLTAPLIAAALALAALIGQTAPDDSLETRLRLETQRRELLGDLQDNAWMQDPARATIARLQIGRHWKACAENEALALARNSERPARLLADAALAACRPWQAAMEFALQNGAYPYVEGPNVTRLVSREDMVTAAQLASRDAALDRILRWRGARGPDKPSGPAQPAADPRARIEVKPAPVPDRLAPPERPAPPEPAAAEGEEPAIVITAQLRPGCRLRLADRTLSEAELADKAREWVANGTALKVVRPRGADYRCMAKIAWQLGKHGLRLFEFVEAWEAR